MNTHLAREVTERRFFVLGRQHHHLQRKKAMKEEHHSYANEDIHTRKIDPVV